MMGLLPKHPDNRNVSLRRSTYTPVLLQESNDEEERQHRRESVQLQRRLSNISQQQVQVNYNNSYIKEHFITCTHLYMENKINSKNVWKIQIIDMLKELCSTSKRDVLQVAGTSLDICAKVYGIRVDDIHSQALKLASNMARIANNPLALEEDGDGALSDNQDTAGAACKTTKKKKKPNRPGIKTTVYPDAKLVIGNLPKLEPTDFSTRVNVQSSTIDNLFTNVLKEDCLGYTFALLDDTSKLFGESDKTVQQAKDIALGMDLVPEFPENKLAINIPFNNFLLNKWDPDKEGQQNLSEQSKIDDVVYDENGFPIPELDGTVHDIFENDDHPPDSADGADDVQFVSEIAPQLRGEVAKIVDLRPNNQTTQLSEYSYNPIIKLQNGNFIDQIWAGPSHWKLKFLKRATTRFTGQETVVDANKKKRTKCNTLQKIDFNVIPDVDPEKEPKVVIKKKPPKADINKIILPMEDSSLRKIFDNLNGLLLKPRIHFVPKRSREQVDYEVSAYKYENPNDSLYCPQENIGDDDGREGDVPEVVETQRNIMKENLVEAPQMVQNVCLPYASKAKQINMKKLKAAEWQYITRSESVATEKESRKVVPTLFSELYQEIPPLLSERERNELTSPLAFFSLLQLANENNLDLEQLPGNKDFKIKGPIH